MTLLDFILLQIVILCIYSWITYFNSGYIVIRRNKDFYEKEIDGKKYKFPLLEVFTYKGRIMVWKNELLFNKEEFIKIRVSLRNNERKLFCKGR